MIPCCFHPTRVIVIDDDVDLLNNLNRHLSSEKTTYQYFNNPQKALNYLNEIYQPNPFPNRYVKNVDEEKWEHRRLDVNIFDTHHEIYRPERFDEISTIIVDHSMPAMSGIELLRQIENPNIQKILLTAIVDEQIAIRAFNEGIIHHYIRKHDMDMIEQLNKAVADAQWRYFNKLSEIGLKAITSVDSVHHAISDPTFQSFFKNLVKQHKFKEAYLCEAMGSYLFLTEDAELYGLIVNNADQLDVTLESAEALHVDKSILKELSSRKKMMFYHNSKGISEPSKEEWANYTYVPQMINGTRDTYYYIFEPNLFDVDHSRVLSFKKHKAQKPFEIQY